MPCRQSDGEHVAWTVLHTDETVGRSVCYPSVMSNVLYYAYLLCLSTSFLLLRMSPEVALK